MLSASLNALAPYFISTRIISVSDDEEIRAQANPNDKAIVLLKKVSAGLEGGYYSSFRDMLSVMRIYGNSDVKRLSQDIIKLLPKEVGMFITLLLGKFMYVYKVPLNRSLVSFRLIVHF